VVGGLARTAAAIGGAFRARGRQGAQPQLERQVPDGRHFIGELVICSPIVAREARDQGKSLTAHWAHMTVHGVLHLLGFDHERDTDAVKMAAKEVQILDRLGFSDPYR
jgi:rRNA maturation RNase YbeY